MNAIGGVNLDGMGKLGVFIFFVLSSFLLTKGFLQRVATPMAIKGSLGTYFFRRFMRIYPLYVLAIFVNYIISLVVGSFYVDSLRSVAEHLLFLDGRGIFWTIPVEFGFYFLLPFIAVFFIAWRNRPVIVFSSILGFILVWQHIYEPGYYPTVIWFLSVFLLGSLAAFLHHYLAVNHAELIVSDGFRRVAGVVAVVCVLVLLFMTPAVYSKVTGVTIDRDHFHYQFVLLGVISSVLVLSVAWSSGAVNHFLETRIMIYFGNISYSLYIWHIYVANTFKRIALDIPIPKFYVYFLVSLVVATLSYKWVEKPFFSANSFADIRTKFSLFLSRRWLFRSGLLTKLPRKLLLLRIHRTN